MQGFNWLDILLAVILLISTVGGLTKGFSREIIGLAASLLGLLLAFQFYRMAGQPLKPYIGNGELSSVAGFLLVFFGVIIAGAIFSSVVRRILKTAGLSSVDRLAGGVYGLLRGSLIAFGIVLAIGTFISSKAVVQSRMAPYLVDASGLVAKAAPRGISERIQQQYQQMKSAWKTPEQTN